MWLFVKNIVQLIISPDNGWDDIAESASHNRSLVGMAWTIFIAAATVYVQLCYAGHPSGIVLTQLFIGIMVSLWATYFIADFVLVQWLPRLNEGVLNDSIFKQLLPCSISLLALQPMLNNLLPINFAILELWPLYVLVILWRAMKVLDIDETQTVKYICCMLVAFVIPSRLLLKGFYNFILQ